MASGTVIAAGDARRQPIARWWHTVLLLAVLATGSIASWYQHGLPNLHLPGVSYRLSGELTVLLEEWFGVFWIWLALRHRQMSIGSLVSGRWHTFIHFFRDLGLAIGFLVLVVPSVGVLAYLLGASNNTNLANMTPRTAFELAIWLITAASAGFGEELVFRGYLTEQFRAWTGSRALALVAQAVAFGLAHGFYKKAMIAIMVQGLLLGLFAYWRKSLLPGMLAHGLQDSIGGIVAFFS